MNDDLEVDAVSRASSNSGSEADDDSQLSDDDWREIEKQIENNGEGARTFAIVLWGGIYDDRCGEQGYVGRVQQLLVGTHRTVERLEIHDWWRPFRDEDVVEVTEEAVRALFDGVLEVLRTRNVVLKETALFFGAQFQQNSMAEFLIATKRRLTSPATLGMLDMPAFAQGTIPSARLMEACSNAVVGKIGIDHTFPPQLLRRFGHVEQVCVRFGRAYMDAPGDDTREWTSCAQLIDESVRTNPRVAITIEFRQREWRRDLWSEIVNRINRVDVANLELKFAITDLSGCGGCEYLCEYLVAPGCRITSLDLRRINNEEVQNLFFESFPRFASLRDCKVQLDWIESTEDEDDDTQEGKGDDATILPRDEAIGSRLKFRLLQSLFGNETIAGSFEVSERSQLAQLMTPADRRFIDTVLRRNQGLPVDELTMTAMRGYLVIAAVGSADNLYSALRSFADVFYRVTVPND